MALRVVLDTDVVVAGFASSTGASRHLLLAALDREVRLLLSTPLLLEYEAVLAMAGVSIEGVLAVLDELAGVCVPVAFDYRWRPQARDPDDDLVLETGNQRQRRRGCVVQHHGHASRCQAVRHHGRAARRGGEED